ncbi:MAG TPA: J domain-containing protein [Candidatus Limnocylindrales bacterium]
MAQRDPHEVLGVDRDASQVTVKAAWRRLAREHHPDLAGDAAARQDATRRMAEINAAYQALRAGVGERPGRSGAPGGGAASTAGQGPGQGAPEAARPSGPPPPPPSRPVTARFDTTHLFRQRNATTTPAGGGYRHRPRAPIALRRATWGEAEEPRASDPTGPLQRVRARRGAHRPLPSLDVALATEIVFGKFHGRTLGEIEALEPTYLEWLERTITRDPDLVAAARVVLDEHVRSRADWVDAADEIDAPGGADPADGVDAGDGPDPGPDPRGVPDAASARAAGGRGVGSASA